LTCVSLTRRLLLAAPLLAAAGPAPKPKLAATPISRMDTKWWRERHAAKLAEARRGRVDLVFLGDSITQQYEVDGPEPFRAFRPVWQRFYGDRNALNLGFSGDATSHLLWRLRNGEIDAITPKVAIILIGANNLGRLHWPVPDTVAGIEAVVAETRHKLPNAKLLLLGVLPSQRSPWATQSTQEINRALAASYGRNGVPWVTWLDIGPVFMRSQATDTSLFLDPKLAPPEPALHPSAEGQARMAAAIEPTLARLMGDRDHTR
jgi:lysophospholipase L1-like esterase